MGDTLPHRGVETSPDASRQQHDFKQSVPRPGNTSPPLIAGFPASEARST
jgi:hypothetical protein